MKKGIFIIMFSLFFFIDSQALEETNKAKDILKSMTIKSLNKKQTVDFISNYVIIFDDKRGDGLVTYYFYDKTYKRYKDLNVISEDYWVIPKIGYFSIFYNDIKVIWKIQIEKENKILVKKKKTSVGELNDFVYKSKTDFYILLEEKKLNE